VRSAALILSLFRLVPKNIHFAKSKKRKNVVFALHLASTFAAQERHTLCFVVP